MKGSEWTGQVNASVSAETFFWEIFEQSGTHGIFHGKSKHSDTCFMMSATETIWELLSPLHGTHPIYKVLHQIQILIRNVQRTDHTINHHVTLAPVLPF